MQTNNHQINDYDAVLDAKFGKPGTPERHVAEVEAARLYGAGETEDGHAFSGSITLHITPEEHSHLVSLARRAGLSLSAYLRGVLAAL